MLDTTMTLPDGRVLGYTDLGAQDAPLVIYFHGAPSTRLDLVAYDEAFASLDVRVVCPDRPGYGTSSPEPGRQLQDWPGDVAALADQSRPVPVETGDGGCNAAPTVAAALVAGVGSG